MIVRLTQLSKSFSARHGTIAAVDGIDLTINDGEFFILLGPSGCGKSTLLNLIAGLEQPTGGSITFDSTVVADAEENIFAGPKERNVAMVFQNYALYPHLSVYENIAFPLRIGHVARMSIDPAVRKAAEQLGLIPSLDAKPGELSGGQRQRVAIARAIVRQPNIFLLDEPLSNLDAQLRTTTRTELKRLQRELNVTTIYVTHDQIEAMTLGDRIALVNKGRIEQVGSPDDLYHKPANPFVASFIGSPPMNLFDAQIHEQNGSIIFEAAGTQADITGKPVASGNPRPGNFTAGIRPEKLSIDSGTNWFTFAAPVHSYEILGREVLLHLSFGRRIMTVLTERKTFTDGDLVTCGFNSTDLYLYPTIIGAVSS